MKQKIATIVFDLYCLCLGVLNLVTRPIFSMPLNCLGYISFKSEITKNFDRMKFEVVNG